MDRDRRRIRRAGVRHRAFRAGLTPGAGFGPARSAASVREGPGLRAGFGTA
jgi:hypothetical protein